jgi:hypothetical protein
MDPQIGQAGFRLALFLILMAGGMLFFLQPGTPERWCVWSGAEPGGVTWASEVRWGGHPWGDSCGHPSVA